MLKKQKFFKMKIEDERLIRYKEKVAYVVKSLEEIPSKPKSRIEVSGIFYNLHTSIEAIMDIIAMFLKDIGEKVEDDYTNIENLYEKKIITRELRDKLKKCNGMRNYLVHRYNKVDEELVLESIDKVKEALFSFIKIVERFLHENRAY